MADFTSALYLGIEHGSRQLAGWERLTLGKPAALESPPGAAGVERELAALVGCERALLATSTLHVFWDLFAILSGLDIHLFVEQGLYPIAKWGVERAAAHGTPVTTFRRQDSNALGRLLAGAGRKLPVIVADGFSPACGTPAPLGAYLDCVAGRGGLVVIDDTQALGIMGHAPGPWAPYGSGGGGSLALAGVRNERIVVVSSMAKAFGAPVAMLAGSGALVSEFESRSSTRVHCSPPSAAAIQSAASALAINRRQGDVLRRMLAGLVSRFRRGLGELNLAASGGLFPVQQLHLPPRADPREWVERLLDRGVQTVLTRASESRGARIGFVLTARHRTTEIDHALASLAELLARKPRIKLDRRQANGKSTIESRAALHNETRASR